MQLLQPLTVLYVRFAPWEVLGLTRIYDAHLKPSALQNLVEGYPVNASGLHRNGLDPAPFQPIRKSMQICRETAEHPYGLHIPSTRHGYPVLCVANIDARGIVIDLRKSIQRPAPTPRFCHRTASIAEIDGLGPGAIGLVKLSNGIKLSPAATKS
jgi:hypothetical protein